MNPAALISAGRGPVGRALYLRDGLLSSGDLGVAAARAVGARTVFINFGRRDLGAILEAHGGRGWLYGLPDAWRPGSWRGTLERCLERVRETGAAGILADPENGWPQASDSEARALGEALAQAARETRVGVTSYPLFPRLDALADACRGWVWGSPQIYGASGGPAEWRAWHARWVRAWGPGSVVPSLAAGGGGLAAPRAFHGSAQGLLDYWRSVPRGAGIIFWPGASIPAHVADAAQQFHPGGSPAGTALYAIRDSLLRPAGAAMLAVLAAVFIVGTGIVGAVV